MWRNPQRATEVFALGVVRFYAQHPDLAKIRFAPVPVNPALRRLCHWVNRMNDEYWATNRRDEASFSKWYRRFIIEETLDIERGAEYELITEMTLYAHQAEEQFGDRFGEDTSSLKGIWLVLLSQVVVLLGKETRVLVGTRHGKPVWRDVSRISDDEIPSSMLGGLLGSYTSAHHVGRTDGWMVPTFRELDMETYRAYEKDTTYLEVTQGLIEAAFYRQRYIVDPEGVYVKVTSARNIEGLYMKVHGRAGTELVDILVRAETADGAIFFVLTEKALVEKGLDTTYFCPGSYLACLAAQVYHDLVTASDYTSSRSPRDESIGGVFAPPRGDATSWTVIPRKIKNVVRDVPRTKIAQRPVTEPHRVTGHLRKSRMSDTHREALERFEDETGLEVLRFIPEGYTFVRPHISPRVSTEDFGALPRFIRYRIQQSLEAALKVKELMN